MSQSVIEECEKKIAEYRKLLEAKRITKAERNVLEQRIRERQEMIDRARTGKY